LSGDGVGGGGGLAKGDVEEREIVMRERENGKERRNEEVAEARGAPWLSPMRRPTAEQLATAQRCHSLERQPFSTNGR